VGDRASLLLLLVEGRHDCKMAILIYNYKMLRFVSFTFTLLLKQKGLAYLAFFVQTVWQYLFDRHHYNGTTHFQNANNYLNTNIYPYLETPGGQSFNLYLNVLDFFNTRVN